MKNRKLIIILITFLGIITLLLTILFVFLLSNKIKFNHFHFSFGNTISNELVLDEHYEIVFEKININTNASKIDVYESIDNDIRLVIHGDKDRTSVSTGDSILDIVSNTKECKGFCFNNKIGKVALYLPSNYDKNLVINNSFGDINVESFNKINVDISSDYGDVKVGNINSAIINQSCGDVNIGNVNDVNVKNSYGDIFIESVTNYLDVNDDCGDIKIRSITLNKNSKINNNFGDIEIGSTNEINIQATASFGDVDINNNYKKSDITLKVTNDCGDIKINN